MSSSACINVWECSPNGNVVYYPCTPLGEGKCQGDNEKWSLSPDGELISGVNILPVPSTTQVWARPLAGGAVAVALLNRGETAANISFTLAEVGLSSAATVRASDVWAGGPAVTISSGKPFEVVVRAHSAEVFRLSTVPQSHRTR